MTGAHRREIATFGAGCFWGVEETFRKISGVVETAVGYMGGTFENPTYEDVCTDSTGHAEVVQVTYNPTIISYERLLEMFWECHDSTTSDKQGPDRGTQYRSVIFFHTPEQEQTAKESKKSLEQSKKFRDPIVTQIVPTQTFYRAEEWHQKYLVKQGGASCHF